jgi:hypothetical protein
VTETLIAVFLELNLLKDIQAASISFATLLELVQKCRRMIVGYNILLLRGSPMEVDHVTE